MSDSYLVRDIMTSAVTTIPLESSLLDAAIAMRRSSVRHLPIVDGDRLVGVITERDVLRWAGQLCDILAYLHAQNPPIIFRDLKPSNMMIDATGSVRTGFEALAAANAFPLIHHCNSRPILPGCIYRAGSNAGRVFTLHANSNLITRIDLFSNRCPAAAGKGQIFHLASDRTGLATDTLIRLNHHRISWHILTPLQTQKLSPSIHKFGNEFIYSGLSAK